MLETKIELWKKSLLDLGKRNRLLSYKETKRSSIRISEPGLEELYNQIAVKEKELSFSHPSTEEYIDGEEVYDGIDDGDIKTNRDIADQQKTLRSLRSKAKTSIQEQGINVLYLVFGFLKWKEDFRADTWIKSPIILVPVSLTIESITDPYKLSLHEDEVVLNPTLLYKMENDFGISMPSFDDFEEDIIGYLNLFEKEVAEKNNWEVLFETDLSLLTFLKINMYEDLESNSNKIENHPLLCGLGGDLSKITRLPEELENFDHDRKLEPKEVFQVVNADSSQQDAILYSKNDASFILQGPPGTGKSQTITNIIAEALADGKKVLFVSEKMAALEVVYRRLTQVGLSDFCLPLHSHKANKKEVLDKLRNTLEMDRIKLKEDSLFLLEKLKEERYRLNKYVEDLHTVNQPLGKSIYEINGSISKLENTTDVIFDIKDVENIGQAMLNKYRMLLENFSHVIGSMKEDYQTNPWVGCNVKYVSHEFRQNIEVTLAKLYSQLKKFINKYSEGVAALGALNIQTLNNAVSLIDALNHVEKTCSGIPEAWLTNANLEMLTNEVKELIERKKEYYTSKNRLTAKYGDKFFHVKEDELWDVMTSDLKKLVSDKYSEIENLKNNIEHTFIQSIYDIESIEYLDRYERDYTNFLKIFKSGYRVDKKFFESLKKDPRYKLSDEEIIEMLKKLIHINNAEKLIVDTKGDVVEIEKVQLYLKYISENDISLKSKLGQIYNGIDTEWERILLQISWAEKMKDYNACLQFSDETLSQICNVQIQGMLKFRDELVAIRQEMDEKWHEYRSLFDNEIALEEIDIYDLLRKIERCKNGMSLLEEWTDYKQNRQECMDNGLGDYIDSAEKIGVLKTELVNGFLKRFYRLWLDKIIAKYPFIAAFRRKVQEERIKSFKELDNLQLEIAKSRIREQLINKLPDTNRSTNARDEIGVLRRELNKKRRIMPIRKLFKQIPNLLMALKPCLMMSPLSVSLFLQADAYEFDIVIFDEASQVKTEDAIGAIMRGKQVIICGDNKQLPPTSFFGATAAGDDYDVDDNTEDMEAGAFESILDESLSVLPERTLKWHYRSKHEHLIAFSNTKIYNNNLITFPACIESVPHNGVEYEFVEEGVYDRSRSRTNIIEAKRIAELVFEHFKNHPNRSLGIVTFSAAQQLAVENAIREIRFSNQQYEDFFNEEKDEPFFVKNLENVQGDERDTIMFSIGYAKDGTGKPMAMNFGPLTKVGGERRLNVAITRAKYNVKLVGSIRPTDIDLSRTNSEGVKLLRSYIEFAINGASYLEREISYSDIYEVDSPFEESVCDFLTSNGYEVATQVGCSGYKIDLAIKHPTLNGRFTLGIECDGATYHSARTARERDAIRQTVLEDMGWSIYRIWSTDWIKDPHTEGKKLLERVERSISEYCEDMTHSLAQKKTNSLGEVTFIEKVSQNELDKESDDKNPYGFVYYIESNPYDVDRVYPDEKYVKNIINYIVEKESPIHFELLCKRLSCIFRREKATKVVRNAVTFYSRYCSSTVNIVGDFYWWRAYDEIQVRVPENKDCMREIGHIAIEELAEAMFQISKNSFGITKESLISATAKEFGFNRLGTKITQAMNNCYDYLINSQRVKIVDEKIIV